MKYDTRRRRVAATITRSSNRKAVACRNVADYSLCVTPCLNYSQFPGDIRGPALFICAGARGHKYRLPGYSLASIEPLICRKFVIRRRRRRARVTRRANCLQYSANSASRRICTAVTRNDALWQQFLLFLLLPLLLLPLQH